MKGVSYTAQFKAEAVKQVIERGDGESGYTLTRRDGKSSIVINELERLERQRFTTCHEVAHLVLSLHSNHKEAPTWSYAKRDDKEILCDIFASDLLMPFEAFNDETFSLLWFEQDSGPDEPVKNWSGVPQHEDDGGLRELNGVLSFSKKKPR